MSTANKDWLQGFLHAGGVSAILRAMRKRVSHFPRSDLDHGVLMELCETLKASMNTADGLEHVAETEGSIEMLALCLDFQCPPLARLVLEILAVTCYFNKSDLVKVRGQLDPQCRASQDHLDAESRLLIAWSLAYPGPSPCVSCPHPP